MIPEAAIINAPTMKPMFWYGCPRNSELMNCPTGVPSAVAPRPAERVPRTDFGTRSARMANIGVWMAPWPRLFSM